MGIRVFRLGCNSLLILVALTVRPRVHTVPHTCDQKFVFLNVERRGEAVSKLTFGHPGELTRARARGRGRGKKRGEEEEEEKEVMYGVGGGE